MDNPMGGLLIEEVGATGRVGNLFRQTVYKVLQLSTCT